VDTASMQPTEYIPFSKKARLTLLSEVIIDVLEIEKGWLGGVM
jgi:hypothetical protein